MKLAIGLFVIAQFALAQGPSLRRVTGLRQHVRMDRRLPAADAPLARPTRHRPRTLRK